MSTMSKATMPFKAFDDDIRMREGYACAKYQTLPEHERRVIYDVAKRFMTMFSKMGPSSALELIIALGSWLNQQPEVKQ